MQFTDADVTDMDHLLMHAGNKYEQGKKEQHFSVMQSLHALMANPNLSNDQIAQAMLDQINDQERKDKAMAVIEKERKEQVKKANEIQVAAAMTTVVGDLCICEPRGKPCIRKAEERFGHMCEQCFRNDNRLSKLPEEDRYVVKQQRKQQQKRQRAEQAEKLKVRLQLAREKREKMKRVKSMPFADSPVAAAAAVSALPQQPFQDQMEYESDDAAAPMAISFVSCAVCDKHVEKIFLNSCDSCGKYAHLSCQPFHFMQHANTSAIVHSPDPRLATQSRKLRGPEPMLVEGPQVQSEKEDLEFDILSLNLEDHKEERLQREQEEMDEENDSDYEEGDDLEAKQEDDEEEMEDSFVVLDDNDVDMVDRPQPQQSQVGPMKFIGGETCASCQGPANEATALFCAVCDKVVHQSQDCMKKHARVCFDLIE
jgi:hypothetical protein